jgi:hypothetical protein
MREPEFKGGPKPQGFVHAIEVSQCRGALVAVIANQLADDGPVLLTGRHVGAMARVVRPPTRGLTR